MDLDRGGDVTDPENDSQSDSDSEKGSKTDDSDDEEKVEKVEKRRGPSEYEKRRQRNIEENKKILAQVKSQYPIREKGQDNGLVTRELPSSNKDKAQPIVTSDATPVLQTSFNTGQVLNNTDANNSTITSTNISLNPAKKPPPASNHEPSTDTAVTVLNNTDANTPPTGTYISPNPATKTPAPPILEPSAKTAITAEKTTQGRPAFDTADTAQPPMTVTPPIDQKIPIPISAHQLFPEADASPSGVTTSGDNEVVMDEESSGVSPPHEIPNDEDLPPWLKPMIGYLRGVTEDVAWQRLVTNFIAFERQQPPIGVSSVVFFSI